MGAAPRLLVHNGPSWSTIAKDPRHAIFRRSAAGFLLRFLLVLTAGTSRSFGCNSKISPCERESNGIVQFMPLGVTLPRINRMSARCTEDPTVRAATLRLARQVAR